MPQTTNKNRNLTLCAVWFLIISQIALAQTTQFTYQGKLTDGGGSPTGQYDLQFQIFAALSGGAALGTVQLEDVQVTNGVFSVKLDFGGANFNNNGAQFLEIGVRPGNQTGAYTMLTPRQQLTSTPYAIKSLNAGTADGLSVACVNCVTSSQIASAPAGSASSYVQNTTTQQPGADFNISGTGTANILVAGTQFNIRSNRILSNAGSSNLFAGSGAGNLNDDLHGVDNSFFGASAGAANTIGFDNSFFGALSGRNNTGIGNSFFGASAGFANTAGGTNSFFGVAAGNLNTTGSNNTIVGWNADVGATNLTNATAIGSSALVSKGDSLVLGSINGVNGATADTNIGIGTTSPVSRLQVVTANDTAPASITAWDSRHMVIGNTASSGGIGMSYDQTNNVGYFGTLHPGVAWGNLILQSGGGNVGIGTDINPPHAKLQVAGGSVYITQPNSLIITSPNGACWFITVNNAGALSTFSIPCP